MTDISLLKKYIPEDLFTLASSFDIPDKFVIDESELIVMVLESRSIDTKEEKQNRFNLLPLMNEEQLEKLRAILVKEKVKLKEIEEKYDRKKKEIKDKYIKKREEDGYVKKVEEIKQKEDILSEKEAEEAEGLLDMI